MRTVCYIAALYADPTRVRRAAHMKDERWRRIESLFQKALQHVPDQRMRFLHEACGGDVSLFEEIQALILSHENAGSFLESPMPQDSASSAASQSIAPGTRFGPYEVRAMLGAGGMGEVYRATDTTLKRDVALKVLPNEFASDNDRLERFKREARLLASLSHPNIAHVYGLEASGSTRCIVMELIEGQTLKVRLRKGPLPVNEALVIAGQIAEALEAAHEKGIIHRDLKPENVKVSNGKVKVLDFGLAKEHAPVAGEISISNSPTISVAATQAGIILGTAAYMSPEQARGHNVDKRSDVWSFGAVLFEMLTGQRAFPGDNVSDVIAAVLAREPDWSKLPADTPEAVRSLLRQCLRKEASRRLHEIADARIVVEDALAEPQPTKREANFQERKSGWVIAGFAACLLIGGFAGWLMLRKPSTAPVVTHLELSLQPAQQLVGSSASVRPSRTAFALSPDGQTIVFTGWPGEKQVIRLYARRLTDSEAKPIPGTEFGIGPFFSPDGQWIGFSAKGQIKKVPITGGPPTVICNMQSSKKGESIFGPFGASWAEDGSIFFADGGSIYKVGSGGGSPVLEAANAFEKGEQLVLPQPLPGGESIMFTAVRNNEWESSQIVVQSLKSHERHVFIQGGADARYVQTGHLLYMKTGTLMAVPFDARKLQALGDPTALIENVMQAVNAADINDATGAGQWAVSNSGTLLYWSGGVYPNPDQTLVWVDRKGMAQPVPPGSAKTYATARISPNRDRIAVAIHPVGNTNFFSRDIWTYDLLGGMQSRLTHNVISFWEVWSPDGKRLVFTSQESSAGNLYVMDADGGGMERLTTSPNVQAPSSWTDKGNLVAFVETPATQINWKIRLLHMDGGYKTELFHEEQSSLAYPAFSPDGHWIAYVSTETGQPAVYVRAYPGAGEKQQISPGGGTEPVWSADGHELFYREGGNLKEGGKFFAVTISSTHPFRTEAPRLLFEESRPAEYVSSGPMLSWDVDPSGQRFLLIRNEESKEKPVTQIHAVLNWTEELKRLKPIAH